MKLMPYRNKQCDYCFYLFCTVRYWLSFVKTRPGCHLANNPWSRHALQSILNDEIVTYGQYEVIRSLLLPILCFSSSSVAEIKWSGRHLRPIVRGAVPFVAFTTRFGQTQSLAIIWKSARSTRLSFRVFLKTSSIRPSILIL